MNKKCNTRCIYFPMYAFEKSKNHYYLDESGVKHNKIKALCMYDDHVITKWQECPNYKENNNIIDCISNDKTLVLVGKSSSGKDYMLNYLVENFGFCPIISHTTRPIRKGEQNGKEYYFIGNSTFATMLQKDEFIETRKYDTKFHGKDDVWYYGMSKNEFNSKTKKICILDMGGLTELVKYYGRNNILSIYINTDDNIREERAKLRGSFSQTEWDRRLKDDNKKFNPYSENIDYIVNNNTTQNDFIKKVQKILRKETLIQ